MKLTHETTDYYIDNCLKNDELGVLITNFTNMKANGLRKAERIEIVKGLRDKMRADWQIEQDVIKRDKMRQLTIDKQNGRYLLVVAAIAKNLEDLIATQVKELADTTKTISKAPPLTLRYHISPKGTITRIHKVRAFDGISKFFSAQASELTCTIQEMRDTLATRLKDAIDDVLSSTEYEHNSTCPMTNLEGQYAFKVTQLYARYMRGLVDAFEKDMEGGKELLQVNAVAYLAR